MKAVILAGGEGVRLRPLTLRRPKPMVPLFDRPLLEHLVCLLRSCGITELCMTLRYLPQVIRDWFGSGEDHGVSLEYRVETSPRGTAGSVYDCRDFIGGEDFLVVSGDAACSFDLRAFLEKHRLSGADATILTYESRAPQEYGLVLTDPEGIVRSFLEKPEPGKLVTDRVNTGIYALSPRILSEIPAEGSYDFGSELFPQLLRQKRRIHTWQPEGYWNDIGSCKAYLQTCRDVLDGRFVLPSLPKPDAERRSWISPEAVIDKASSIGPYCVIGAGSHIGPGCMVSESVLMGAALTRENRVQGSLLCEGVSLGAGAETEPGTVLAEGVIVGEGCHIQEEVRVWPDKSLPGGRVICHSVMRGESEQSPRFQDGGFMTGEYGREIRIEQLFRMGAARMSVNRVSAASSGGSAAALSAEAFLLGCGSVGREVFRLDASVPATAAYAGSAYDMELTVFVRQEGSRLRLFFFDRHGLPVSSKLQRAMEASINGETEAVLPRGCHSPALLLGTEEILFSAASSLRKSDRPYTISVTGSELTKQLLRRAGFSIVPPASGTAAYSVSADGFSLSAIDESGRHWDHGALLSAYAAVLFSEGTHAVCLPASAPYTSEEVAKAFGGSILRLELDEDAADLLPAQPWCRNGILLCIKLLSALRAESSPIRLSELMDSLPRCYRQEVEIETAGSELSLLRRLSEAEETCIRKGLYLKKDNGAVQIRRLERNKLRLLTESTKAEFAAELCEGYTRKLKALDTPKE